MSDVTTICSFSDEIRKLADSNPIPLIRRLPRDPDRAAGFIERKIDSSGRAVLGHPSVAVPVRKLGDLEEQGFKKTRLSIPLPGEGIGAVSWRKGNLHAHMIGGHYVFHKDLVTPQGVRKNVSHFLREGVPAAARKIREFGTLEIEQP